jgi:hypothetical protein
MIGAHDHLPEFDVHLLNSHLSQGLAPGEVRTWPFAKSHLGRLRGRQGPENLVFASERRGHGAAEDGFLHVALAIRFDDLNLDTTRSLLAEEITAVRAFFRPPPAGAGGSWRQAMANAIIEEVPPEWEPFAVAVWGRRPEAALSARRGPSVTSSPTKPATPKS